MVQKDGVTQSSTLRDSITNIEDLLSQFEIQNLVSVAQSGIL